MKKTNLLGAKIFVEEIGDFFNTYTGEAKLVGYGTHRPNCYIVEIPKDFGWAFSDSINSDTDVYMAGYNDIPKGSSLLYCGIDSIQIVVGEEEEEIKRIGGICMLDNKDFIVKGINRKNVKAVADKVTKMGYIKTMHHEDLAIYTDVLIGVTEDSPAFDWTADLATGTLFGGAIKFADYIMDGFDEDDLIDIRENVVVITADDFLAL